MNKAELINAVSERMEGGKRTAGEAVDVVLDTITRAVAKGDKVAITGFGVFEKVDRPARTARNPATGEKVRVKKTAVPKFRAGQGFKDVVSGSKKLPRIAKATKTAAKAPATKSTAKKTPAKKTTAKKAAKKR